MRHWFRFVCCSLSTGCFRFRGRVATLLVVPGLVLSFTAGSVLAATLPPLQLVDQAGQPVGEVVARIDRAEAESRVQVDEAVMDQSNLSFTPRVLAISTGTEVSFPNSDDTRHHV